MHHVEVALDGDGWLAPAAIEQRDSGGDAVFVRTQGIDEGGDGFCRVLARESLDALWGVRRDCRIGLSGTACRRRH